MTESCAARAPIAPSERLFVPHRKRLSKSYAINDDGVRELRIDYGIKEVSFDEERLFPFGEQLVSVPSFTGEEALGWGPGYQWDEVQPLLEALLDEGIIKCGEPSNDHRGGGLVASPLPPSRCPMARTWSAADCESITRDLAKRPVEIGYLEAAVPVYRVAHSALDADDRQVGEANVYPPALRLDRETEWRVCQYPGSRYQDDSPMNITALKAMIKHWKPMMAALLVVRRELEQRLGISGKVWSIGDLHTLSCTVLALPAFQLMKGGGSSPQPPLHPVLSSLFRITDGIRMTTYEMQFLLSEKPRHVDDPMTAAELYGYAEQHGVFISPTGVCAGPRPLIDEFLVTAVDGLPADGLEGLEHAPEVQALLDQLPAVLDYGLYGLQVWGLSQTTWLLMSQAYRALLEIFERLLDGGGASGGNGGHGSNGGHGNDALSRLLAALRADWIKLERAQIAKDYDRDVHQLAYTDAYERARRAARKPVGAVRLADAVAPVEETAAHRGAAAQLTTLLADQLGGGERVAGAAGQAAAVLTHYLRQEQAVLGAVTELQQEINALLDRPRPQRALSALDLRVFFGLNGSSYPYLFDALGSALEIGVENVASAAQISGGARARRAS